MIEIIIGVFFAGLALVALGVNEYIASSKEIKKWEYKENVSD